MLWFKKKPSSFDPKTETTMFEYSDVAEDFAKDGEVIHTEDDVYVSGINILQNTKEKS